jgi:hypothetical protein
MRKNKLGIHFAALLRRCLIAYALVSYTHVTFLFVKHRSVFSNVSWQSRQPFRAPEQKFTIILSQLVIRRIIQRTRGAIVGTEMAKTAARVPVLREPVFRVLWMFFFVFEWDEGDASFGADPGADSASCAFF